VTRHRLASSSRLGPPTEADGKDKDAANRVNADQAGDGPADVAGLALRLRDPEWRSMTARNVAANNRHPTASLMEGPLRRLTSSGP